MLKQGDSELKLASVDTVGNVGEWRRSKALRSGLFISFIDRTAEDMINRMREGEEWHVANKARPGLNPRAPAARTKPLHMGCPLYQLS